MWWNLEIILPLVLGHSLTKVLSINYNSLEAWLGRDSSDEVLDHSISKSSVELKVLGSLSTGCFDNLFNTAGAC
jgi:hypothetical protein